MKLMNNLHIQNHAFSYSKPQGLMEVILHPQHIYRRDKTCKYTKIDSKVYLVTLIKIKEENTRHEARK